MRRPLHPELPLISPPGASCEATDAPGDVEARRARIRGAIADFYKSVRLKRGARR